MGAVVVAGGGVAGCAAAIALRRRGWTEVTILDPGPAAGPRVGETLPPDARALLGELGLGAAFDAQGHAPCYGNTSCWGSAERGFNDHFTHPAGHGWHLDRARFDAWLADEAARAGVTVARGARVVDARRAGTLWEVEGSDGQRRTADWLVDATGALSSVGRRQGARRLDHDRLVYLACTLVEATGRSGQTWLEATQDGWWYAARLPSGDWTAAFATDPEAARGFTQVEAWSAALRGTLHLGPRLGDLPIREAAPQVWVAPSALLGPPAGPGWLAVGDAAASWDPICARGITKALGDGLRAARAIDGDGVAGYATETILSFRTYLQERARLYASEPRWADAPFWRRRRERRALGAPSTPPGP